MSKNRRDPSFGGVAALFEDWENASPPKIHKNLRYVGEFKKQFAEELLYQSDDTKLQELASGGGDLTDADHITDPVYQHAPFITLAGQEVRRIIVLLNQFVVHTEEHVARQCGEVAVNLMEGDHESMSYQIKLPSNQSVDMIAFFFRTGTFFAEQIPLEKFASFVENAEYLQSDFLLHQAKQWFSNEENVRELSNHPLFGVNMFEYRLFSVLLDSDDLLYTNSFWREIFEKWFNSADENTLIPVKILQRFNSKK